MKDIKSTLLDRRSIRRYEREAIPAETMEFIYEAIRNTPTSYNGQQYSVIDVDDQELKEQLYAVTGQKQIKTCNHFMVFCADYNKIYAGAKAKGVEMPPFTDTADGITVGTVDAALTMMSAVVAAEACGLGTCPIGYLRTADPEAVTKLLHLPEHVFVVCGLAIGVPREMPDLKPKQPRDLVVFKNRYRADDITADVLAYDDTVSHYNRTREGHKTENDWVAHIIGYYREAMNYRILEAWRERGFNVKR